jgi:CRP-like cAMP-binding protein
VPESVDSLVLRLRHGVILTDREVRALRSLLHFAVRDVPVSVDLAAAGDRPTYVHVLLKGFACRYRLLEDGRRQIIAFMLPGDFCNLSEAALGTTTYGVATLSPCAVADVLWHDLQHAADRFTGIARALAWSTLVENAVLQEWLVNLGQRQAEIRMAHLFCELACRLTATGSVDADGYPIPLTQRDLGDALGVSTVHVNRVLQTLRGAGLIRLANGHLTLPSLPALSAYARFTPHYLHLRREAVAMLDLHG